MKKILLSLLLTFSVITNANYEADVDYVVFDKPVKTVTGDKVEVRELFWYYCPHCFDIEPLIKNWLKDMPSSAQFVRQPAVFSDRWMSGAIFYYVLEQLGEVDRLHEALFNAIHAEKEAFIGSEDFVEWLVEHGVDKAKAENAFKSFSVRVKVNQSKVNTKKYKGLNGVPAFVVAGKYLVDTKHAGSENRMFDVINYLIKKETKVE
mgnify:FL=1